MKRIFLITFFFIISCSKEQEKPEDFSSYNFTIDDDSYLYYNFKTDILRVEFLEYLNGEFKIDLSEESRKKIIHSFSKNKIYEMRGDKHLIPKEGIIMPPSTTNIAILHNEKIQSYFKISAEYESDGIFSNKEFKRIKRFENDVKFELKKNEKYNLIKDSILRIQRKNGFLHI